MQTQVVYSALPADQGITPTHTATWQGMVDLFFAAASPIGRRLPGVLGKDGKPVTGPWRDRHYRETTKCAVVIHQAATLNVMAQHLSGVLHHDQARAWLQSYAASQEGQAVYTAVDFDVEGDAHGPAPEHFATPIEAMDAARKLIAVAEALGLSAHLEITKSGGYRGWIFHRHVPAAHARDLGRLLIQRAGLHPSIEVFPKTVYFDEGQVGSAVFVPYGAHHARQGRQVMLHSNTGAVRMVEEFVQDALAHRSDPALVERIVTAATETGELKPSLPPQRQQAEYDGESPLAQDPDRAAQAWEYQVSRCAALLETVARCEQGVQISRADWLRLATHLRPYGDLGYTEFHRLSGFDDRYNEETDALWNSLRGGPVRCDRMECGRDPQADCGMAEGKVSAVAWAYERLRQLPMAGGRPLRNMETTMEENQEENQAGGETTGNPAGGFGLLDAELAHYASLDDVGNQMRLVQRHGKNLRHCESGHWYTYNSQVWERMGSDGAVREMAIDVTRKMQAEIDSIPDDAPEPEAAPVDGEADGAKAETKPSKADAKRAAYAAWRKISRSARKIADMVTMARSHPDIRVRPDEFDRDPWLLAADNGTLDLRTWQVQPSQPSDLITRKLGVAFDPNAEAPTWGAFLARVLPDAEVREYVQRYVGYCLTGLTSEQVFLFFYGSGQNGKGTFLETMDALFGDHHARIRASVIASGSAYAAEARFGLVPLVGRRLVTFGELEERASFNETLLKELTGEDPIEVETKGKQPYQYKPKAKYILAGNYKPRISGTDLGVWRRVRLVPFTVTIPPEERDGGLRDKLRAELPGVLNWALDGFETYTEKGRGDVSKAIRDATGEYKEDSDVLGQFLGEKVMRDPAAEITAADLYDEYRAWCQSSGHTPMAINTLSTRLKDRSFAKGDGRRRYTWVGVRRRTFKDETDEQKAYGPDAEGRGTSPAPRSFHALGR